MERQFLQELFGMNGQTVVVIGGTGVIGSALATGIAQAGARVVIAGRDQEKGQRCVETIRSLGGHADFMGVDVSSRAEISALVERSVKDHGAVHGLVNCAGTNASSDYFSASDEDWQRVLQTNLTSTHWACQAFGRHMADRGQGGAMVNVGSVTCDLPLSGVFAYSASKAAVLSLTRNVARELAGHRIRVNALCPGFFPAEQNRKILTPERVEAIMRHTPMQRFGEPQELVGPTLLLLAPAAGSFITGAAFYVDGGFTAMTI